MCNTKNFWVSLLCHVLTQKNTKKHKKNTKRRKTFFKTLIPWDSFNFPMLEYYYYFGRFLLKIFGPFQTARLDPLFRFSNIYNLHFRLKMLRFLEIQSKDSKISGWKWPLSSGNHSTKTKKSFIFFVTFHEKVSTLI